MTFETFVKSLNPEQLVALYAFRDELNAMHSKVRSEVVQHYEASEQAMTIKVIESESAAKQATQDLADIRDLLGEDPKIAELKRQKEIDAIDAEIEAAKARKAELEAEPVAAESSLAEQT